MTDEQINLVWAAADRFLGWKSPKNFAQAKEMFEHCLQDAVKNVIAARDAQWSEMLEGQEPVAQLGDGFLWCHTCKSVQNTTDHASPQDHDVWCKGQAHWVQGPFYTHPAPKDHTALLRQALEALQTCGYDYDYEDELHNYYDEDKVDEAIKAIEEELK